MATLDRLRVTWSGLGGLPGLSTFYLTDVATPDLSAVTAFFNSIKAFFPSGLSWDVPNGGDKIDSATGELTGSWSGINGGVVAASGSGAYAAGTGAYIIWRTAGIVGGRRLQGRTFLCPLTAGQYEADGTLNNTNRATIQTAGNTFLATLQFNVWHRPSPSAPSGGAISAVTSASVLDRVTSLRSRRV